MSLTDAPNIRLPARYLFRGYRKRLLFLLLLFLFTIALIYRHYNKQPNSEFTTHPDWLSQTEHVPKQEYEDLLAARHSRPLPWTNSYKPIEWRATEKQQKELNAVIRNAITSSFTRASNKDTLRIWEKRQKKVTQAVEDIWASYKRDAFGSDEYYPGEHRGTNMTRLGIGYFIADTLDTLLLMGLNEEYAEGREFLANNVTFDQTGTVSLFETTIRVLGGILSAYHWTGESDTRLLELAEDLGSRLLKSFNTSTGIPPETAFLRQYGAPLSQVSSTAEVTTLQMEFRYLSKLTGKQKFREAVDKIMSLVFNATRYDGLVPIYIDGRTGKFTNDDIRLGSRGDSYYEYLLKQWLQTRRSEQKFRSEYDEAMEGVKRHLLAESLNENLLFVGELVSLSTGIPKFSPKMDHLVCFLSGNLALGATNGLPLSEIPPNHLTARDREDLIIARELAETCVRMYFDTATGLAPEIGRFRWQETNNIHEVPFSTRDQLKPPNGDIIVNALDRHSLLRPETVESLLVLWRITGEEKWREYGWHIFESFEKWAKEGEHGTYANIKDVTQVPVTLDTKMETFFVSETLKYLFLLFGNSSVVPLEQYVFNTEAHPFPVFEW